MGQISFDYRYHLPKDSTSLYPAAEVSLKGTDGHWRPFVLFVDSGAHMTILTASDAARLGFDIAHGRPISLYGISGTAKAYIHFVPMRLGEKEFNAEVAFSLSDDTPRLLGRADVFSQFVVTFWESRRKTIFVEEPIKALKIKP